MTRLLVTVLGADHARPLRHLVAILALGAVLQGVAFVLLVPVLRALLGDDPSQAWPWLGWLALATLAAAAAHYAGQLRGYRIGAELCRTLHRRIGDHVAALPLGWFTAQCTGELGRLTSQGVVELAGVPARLLRPLVNGFLTPAVVVVLMFLFDWRIALAALVSLPLLLIVYQVGARVVQRADVGRHEVLSEAGGRVVEFAQTQPVLRAFGRTVDGNDLLDNALRGQRDVTRRLLWTGLPGLVGLTVAAQAAFTAIIVVGAYLALGGSLHVPELLALLVLAVRFVEPVIQAADIGQQLKITRNTLARIADVLAEPPLPEPDRPRVPDGNDIEFRDVTFGYDDRPVLRNVSLHIPEGTMTALVGPSGSGKTTVTRLIARFFDTGSGSVRVGGVDVRDIGVEQLMSRMSLVFQDVYLFDGTIEDNIRVGRPEASSAEVRRAGRLARVDSLVERLPDSWDTRVGEGGVAVSGGERQRISIARALLKDAPIVLLDEATAALDPENERAVQEAFAVLATERTLLVIAHRLQTVVAADQIVVLDDGGVTEVGRHEELLAHGGRYADFWAQRQRAAGWRLRSEVG